MKQDKIKQIIFIILMLSWPAAADVYSGGFCTGFKAVTSLVKGPEAVYHNPANLTATEKTGIYLSTKDLFNDDIFQTVFGAMSFSFADSEIGMGVGYNRIGYKGRQDINYNENIILSGIGYDILALLKKNTAIRSIFQQMSVGFAFKAHIYRYLDYYGNSGDFNLGFNLKMKEKFFNIALAGVLYNTLARVIYDEWSKIERGHLMRYAALGISSELVNIIPGTARAGFDIELSGIDKHTSSTGLTIKAGLGYTLPFEWLGFAVGMEKGKNSFILSDAVIIRAGDIFRAELASEWLAEASGDGFPLRFNIGGRLNF